MCIIVCFFSSEVRLGVSFLEALFWSNFLVGFQIIKNYAPMSLTFQAVGSEVVGGKEGRKQGSCCQSRASLGCERPFQTKVQQFLSVMINVDDCVCLCAL